MKTRRHHNNKVPTRCRLDYGCGRGHDADCLDFVKYDPYYFPSRSKLKSGHFDIITCNYVLNVIEDVGERQKVLDDIMDLLAIGCSAYISVRSDKSYLNGLTKRGTWQGKITMDLPIVVRSGKFVMYELKKSVLTFSK